MKIKASADGDPAGLFIQRAVCGADRAGRYRLGNDMANVTNPLSKCKSQPGSGTAEAQPGPKAGA
jgi:hypothetical protein